ncbi:hypothetical protein D3C71_468700 [compost metagenome]
MQIDVQREGRDAEAQQNQREGRHFMDRDAGKEEGTTPEKTEKEEQGPGEWGQSRCR